MAGTRKDRRTAGGGNAKPTRKRNAKRPLSKRKLTDQERLGAAARWVSLIRGGISALHSAVYDTLQELQKNKNHPLADLLYVADLEEIARDLSNLDCIPILFVRNGAVGGFPTATEVLKEASDDTGRKLAGGAS